MWSGQECNVEVEQWLADCFSNFPKQSAARDKDKLWWRLELG